MARERCKARESRQAFASTHVTRYASVSLVVIMIVAVKTKKENCREVEMGRRGV